MSSTPSLLVQARLALLMLVTLLAAACGGGGGDGGGGGGGGGGGTTPVSIGGKVSGLTGSGLVLKDNGGDDLSIAADGTFKFTTTITSGSNYDVTVSGQPRSPMQLCAVSGGKGTAGTSDVTSIAVSCASPVPVMHTYAIGATDLAWDSHSGSLYVALGSAAPASPDSIAVVDPLSGALGAKASAGMTPSVIRISDDGTLLYAGSNSSASIQRFQLPALASDISIPLGYLLPDGPGSPIATQALEVKPGAAHTIAVSRFDPTVIVSMDVAIFDDATMRGSTPTTGSPNDPYLLAWSADGTQIYGGDPRTSPTSVGIYAATSTGAVYQSTVQNVSPGFYGMSFLDGKLYMSSGSILAPATQDVVGSVPGGVTVVDQDNGVLFVVQYDQLYGNTLIAYDLAHLVPIGRLSIPGLSTLFPTVLHAVRYGSDGFAMVTSTGNLIVVEHALTLPEPAAGGDGALLKSVTGSTSYSIYDLPARSMVWSADQSLLYVSLPSTAGGRGNSIAAFDPATGAITASAFVGSEPSHLALSSDGKTLFAALRGASEVAQVSVPELTPGPSLLLGSDAPQGPKYPSSVEVAPGSDTTLAVLRLVNDGQNTSGAIYDGKTVRQLTVEGSIDRDLLWGSDASTLFIVKGGSPSGVDTIAADTSGMKESGYFIEPLVGGPSGAIHFVNGLVYGDDGTIYDPATKTIRASIAAGQNSVMAVDAATKFGFFASSSSQGLTLVSVDLAHGNVVSTFTVPGVYGSPLKIVRWGNDGLALATDAGQLLVVRGTLVTKPAPTNPCGAAVGSALTSAGIQAADFSSLLVAANASDIVSESHSGLVYASISSSSSSNGNCVVPIVPSSGSIGAGAFAGSRPGPLAVSDDGSLLYAALAGANSIERFKLPSLAHDISISSVPPAFARSQPIARDIAVAPGAPATIAASLNLTTVSPSGLALAVFDNGIARPSMFTADTIGSLQWGMSSSTLYGYDTDSSAFSLFTLPVTANGVAAPSATVSVFNRYGVRIHQFNNLIYGDNGQVVDPTTGTLLGTFVFSPPFQVPPSVMTADTALGLAYVVYNDASNGQLLTLQVFKLADYSSVRTEVISSASGTPLRVNRWGTNGLAILLDSGSIVLVSGSLISG